MTDFVAPDYGGRSLGDVLPAVARAMGLPLGFHDTALELPAAPSYLVMLVDGMGFDLLRAHPREAPYLNSLIGDAGTAGVPSTTATSLTSLGTALTPGQHGLVGYTSRIPGTDRLLNALSWDHQVDPLEWQPHTTAFQRFAAAGVATSVISKAEFENSGLTRSSQRGATYRGADDADDRLGAALQATQTSPSLTYLYDSELDWTGHRFGVDSVRWRAVLADIDDAAQELRERLPEQVRIVIVADHGMVDASGADRIDIDQIAGLRQGVGLLGGEARFRHLYTHIGAASDVAETWRAQLGDRAEVLLREEAIARGWFGPVEDRVRPRLGDVVVAARGTTALFSSADFDYEMRLVGLHGSLTAAEMQIPILIA